VNGWLEIRTGGEWVRHDLRARLTTIGGVEADIALTAPGGSKRIEGELHVFADPPRIVRVGGPELCGVGAPTSELELSNGMRFSWGGVELCYSSGESVLEEIEVHDSADFGHAEDALDEEQGADLRAWHRVHAGLLVELGLADRAVVRRWQEMVKSMRFEPDACSRELLAGTRVPADDPLLVDRCGSLLRDLVMAPLLRGTAGAGRRARGAAKSGVAFVLAQVIAIGVYSLLIAVLLILLRVKWDVSFDGLIDALLG
jgi:hypothetical protein